MELELGLVPHSCVMTAQHTQRNAAAQERASEVESAFEP